MEQNISSEKFKRFLYHLAMANNKMDDIGKHRIKLQKTLVKTKEIAASRPKKEVIEGSFDKLEKQLNELMQKEGFLAQAHMEETAEMRKLKNRIAELELKLDIAAKDREVVEQLKLNLAIANQKLSQMLSIEKEREQKMQQMEKRLNEKVSQQKAEKSKKELMKQLESLEDKYYDLRHSGVHDEAVLSRLSSKIGELKKQLVA